MSVRGFRVNQIARESMGHMKMQSTTPTQGPASTVIPSLIRLNYTADLPHHDRQFSGTPGFYPSLAQRTRPCDFRSPCSKDRSSVTYTRVSTRRATSAPNRISSPITLELAPESRLSTYSSEGTHFSPEGLSAVQSRTQSRSSMAKSRRGSKEAFPCRTNGSRLYPYIVDTTGGHGDLSYLCRPQKIMSKDSPWVFRYKVKKHLNQLSWIMASKPISVSNYSVNC